ncbi:hypothetical protein JCM10213v2_007260 [Rhodosporidiobolus nylandii]
MTTPNDDASNATAGLANVGSPAPYTATRADKGKMVVRDGEHAQESEEEQRRRVDKVLKRAEAAKNVHQAGGMDAILAGGASSGLSHKRSRQVLDPIYEQHHPNTYNNASVYAPSPQPVQHVSPYSTAGIYQAAGSGLTAPILQDARPTKRRHATMDDTLGGGAFGGGGSKIGQASPRARTKSGRRSSPGKTGLGQPNPLSSSDPNFSSFVDAATALTGMARAPSDPSQNGSDEEARSAGPGGGSLLGAFEQPHSALPLPPPPPFPRPATPERAGGPSRLPGAPGGTGGSEGQTAAEAADLMLYLAASPSPQQPRRTVNQNLGGEGAATGMKGRRLFSGVGEHGGGGAGGGSAPRGESSIFGGELPAPQSPFANGSALDAPFAAPSPSTDPHKPSVSALPPPPAPSSLAHEISSASAAGAPATPGRQRQPSLNGASWDAFINESPRREGSPPHGAIGGTVEGQAQAAW